MPEAPQPPEAGDCCNGGCERCVYDLYEEALDRYREALRAWQARHPDGAASSHQNRSTIVAASLVIEW